MEILNIFGNLSEMLNNSKSIPEFLHACHKVFEQPIYNLLTNKYLKVLSAWWDTYKIPLVTETNKAIVIYETRKHPNLEFLIYNLTYFARGYSLILFCSNANVSYIYDILKHNRYRCIINIVREDEGGESVRDIYNAFVSSSEFWNSLPCEYVLMAEMDSYLRKPLPTDITNFEYVCCEWPWEKTLSGGGGISFRKVSTMKIIVQKFPLNEAEKPIQDNWAARGCKYLNVPCNNSYFVEGNHTIQDPIGFHQWWTFVHPSSFLSLYASYERYLILEIKQEDLSF